MFGAHPRLRFLLAVGEVIRGAKAQNLNVFSSFVLAFRFAFFRTSPSTKPVLYGQKVRQLPLPPHRRSASAKRQNKRPLCGLFTPLFGRSYRSLRPVNCHSRQIQRMAEKGPEADWQLSRFKQAIADVRPLSSTSCIWPFSTLFAKQSFELDVWYYRSEPLIDLHKIHRC